MDQFILFGDSLTQQAFSPEPGCLGAALNDAYLRKLDIINRGFSGYNTTQALEILPQFMPPPSQERVRFFAIFFGANDARLPDTPSGPQQHVPKETFKSNLHAIATHPCVRAHNNIRIVLITPPAVDERMLMLADQESLGEPMLRRTSLQAAAYAGIVREVGNELRIPVLDLWSAMLARAATPFVKDAIPPKLPGMKDQPRDEVLQSFLRDGLHFTRKGYEVLYEELLKLIEKTWPDQSPDRLPFTFPRWDDVEAWKYTNGMASL